MEIKENKQKNKHFKIPIESSFQYLMLQKIDWMGQMDIYWKLKLELA